MSTRDVETVREAVKALNRRDVGRITAVLDPDVELVPLRAVLDGTAYRGHEGLRQWLADMSEDWVEYELGLQEVRDLGADVVLVRATIRARGRSGVALASPAAWLCDMRGGKVSRIRFFENAEAALAAAG